MLALRRKLKKAQRGGYGRKALPNWKMFAIVVSMFRYPGALERFLKGRKKVLNEAGVFYLTHRIELPIIR